MALTVPEVTHHPIENLHLQNRDTLQSSRLWQNTVPGLSVKVVTFSDQYIFTKHAIFTFTYVYAYVQAHIYKQSHSLSLTTSY